MRKLATIRKVTNIRPIEGKDLIEQVNVDGWNVIVKKDEFKDGDLCVYIEIDSKLPARPEFEFLAKKDYTIKTMKMAGVRSEGIVFPLSILPKKVKAIEGTDVTKVLGVEQYNKEAEVELSFLDKIIDAIDTKMRKFAWYRKLTIKSKRSVKKSSSFPNWIKKTDEERIQNKPNVLSLGHLWLATEKLDGSSATYGYRNVGGVEEYVICSRNKLITDETEVWSIINKKYNLEATIKHLFKKLKAKESLVIQGEIIGPKIQGNKYKLDEHQFFIFNLVVDGVKMAYHQLAVWQEDGGLTVEHIPIVPMYGMIRLSGDKNVDDILNYATFKSKVNQETLAEGLVFRTFDEHGVVVDSFKAVSPKFLMKHDE
jgi:hypothetical protein